MTPLPAAKALDAHFLEARCKILDLAAIYRHGSGFLAALKGACALIGIGNGRPAAPGAPASEAERAAIGEVLRRNGIGTVVAPQH